MFKSEINLNQMTNVNKLTISAMVIALYVVLMFLTQGFAFGQYQVRIATSLYALSAVYPFLILALGLANFLSNTLMGGLGVFDMLGGFVVGILTSLACFYLRKINVYLVAVPILLFPTLLVPIWLSYLLGVPYTMLVVSVGIGQILPAAVGILIVMNLERIIRKG